MTNDRAAFAILLPTLLLGAAFPATAAPRAAFDPASVATLLEDNADALLPLLTNPTGDPGEGHVERGEVFSGRTAVRIVPMQRFEPRIAGWNYRVVERPAAPGEYRFVRFAWRADGCAGTMVQFHIETGWSVRYCAGRNEPGWGAKDVAPTAPEGRWAVVTRDLFADFGACTVTGIALTAFGGRGAYFDHVYFGRTAADLDRAEFEATMPAAARPAADLGDAELERLWAQLCGDDARAAFRARCALAAADPARAAPFIRRKAEGLPTTPAGRAVRVRDWVAALGAADPGMRDAATEALARHAEEAAPLLAREAAESDWPEVRARASVILQGRARRGPWPDEALEARRVLGLMDGPVARACLDALGGRPDGTQPPDPAGR